MVTSSSSQIINAKVTRDSTAHPVIDILDDVPRLVQSISEATDIPPLEVAKRLQREHNIPGISVLEEIRQRGITPFVWSDKLEEFYSQTNAFVIESTVWNRSPLKKQMRSWMAGFLNQEANAKGRDDSTPLRVLVFGDGQGYDSYYLARLGYQVDYFEVSQNSCEFARRMFQEDETPVRVISSIGEFDFESYDAVVCLDVLEHIPAPGKVVALLAKLLRTGGKLIVHAPFWYYTKAVVTHLKANRQYSGDVENLYYPHGLRAVDASLFWNPIALEKVNGERNDQRMPWKLNFWIGRFLLSIGRYWSLPHHWVTKFLSDLGRRPWTELDEYVRQGSAQSHSDMRIPNRV